MNPVIGSAIMHLPRHSFNERGRSTYLRFLWYSLSRRETFIPIAPLCSNAEVDFRASIQALAHAGTLMDISSL